MKPTPEQVIALAREAGIDRESPYTAVEYREPWNSCTDEELVSLVHLALERFGAGGGEPVAYMCPTSRAMADGSMEDGPDYLEWADEASDYEKRVGTPLYTHPSSTDLRAEYLRGLEDAAMVADDDDHVVEGRGYYDQLGDAKLTAANIRNAIEALKGKQ